MSDPPAFESQAHLSPEQIVGYIDQTINEGTRKQVEGHLAECETCLREVLEVTGLLRGPV